MLSFLALCYMFIHFTNEMRLAVALNIISAVGAAVLQQPLPGPQVLIGHLYSAGGGEGPDAIVLSPPQAE